MPRSLKTGTAPSAMDVGVAAKKKDDARRAKEKADLARMLRRGEEMDITPSSRRQRGQMKAEQKSMIQKNARNAPTIAKSSGKSRKSY